MGGVPVGLKVRLNGKNGPLLDDLNPMNPMLLRFARTYDIFGLPCLIQSNIRTGRKYVLKLEHLLQVYRSMEFVSLDTDENGDKKLTLAPSERYDVLCVRLCEIKQPPSCANGRD